MRIHLLILVLFVFVSQICISGMPQCPNFEELCEHSELVVKAAYISSLPKEIKLKNGLYAEFIFEIQKSYKGKTDDSRISVLIPTNGTQLDYILPAYQKENEYFLFLQKHKGNLYIRSSIDDVWGERLCNPEDETFIEGEIREQSQPDRWLQPEDNLTYKIPPDANEREVSLSDYQKDRYLEIIQYLINDEVVGERGWYKNGVLAYESPYKNGLRHGIAKGWHSDGFLLSICCYRKDRGHGYVLKWSPSNLEVTFWVRGKYVSQEQYMKECKKNITLPKVNFK